MEIYKKHTIICGHAGCGKTNFTINLAVALLNQGKKVTIADLDIVNPYFRSSDYRSVLEEKGIKMICPVFAGTNIDLPAYEEQLREIFKTQDNVILDVGGDSIGAKILGHLSREILQTEYEMLYVVNYYRPLISHIKDSHKILKEIEDSAQLFATGIVNNSHLQELTTMHTVKSAWNYGEQTAKRLKLPLKATTVPRWLSERFTESNIYPVDIFVKPPWENVI